MFVNKNRLISWKAIAILYRKQFTFTWSLDHVHNDVNTNSMNIDENTTNGISDIDNPSSNIVEIDWL